MEGQDLSGVGTAFPLTERDRLGLRGLLPPRVMSFEQQYERFSESSRVPPLPLVKLGPPRAESPARSRNPPSLMS